MRSTFMGLETSKRGLYTQQSALYTTGHNISNANTIGYSRQRINMQATLGYPGAGLNAPKTPGHIGTGVEAGSVQRIRDEFIDRQYRQENNKLGYWQSKSEIITQMEDVLNEPSDYGLSKSMDEFWGSLEDLSAHPNDGGARAVVVQRAKAIADSFNYMHKSLSDIQKNTGKEIGVSLKDVNSILEQIASLNKQIQAVEPNGYMPNDLYDARDVLIDKLSNYFPIETQRVPSGGNALGIAEGSLTVSVKLNGKTVELVNGKDFKQFRTTPSEPTDGVTPTGAIEGLSLVTIDAAGNATVADTIAFSDLNETGKLKSLINSYGYMDSSIPSVEKGLLTDMIAKLNLMANSFAEEFNKIHMGDGSTDYPKGSDLYGKEGGEFFVSTTAGGTIDAGNITISKDIVDDPNKIVASDSAPGTPEPGNGKFALKLANMKFASLAALGNTSVQTYFTGLIGQLGVDGQQASKMQYSSETLQLAVLERRASVSSVSLDEEMTNMIMFQQAYNASARMITVVDETLDKIINGMGRTGL
ncbi:flagellar hook-associated protein FlgK [Viridibacillus sp. NPDC093762]|uniref:flagellar hook-associated protein FlgK n=1 Tax=Viridibacillus sp. NPDC093762 TaxID=3390720 RepID=UPI003CFDE2D2